MSCGSKYEDRKQREGKRRFNGKLGVNAQYAGETQRERERKRDRDRQTDRQTEREDLHELL